MDKLYVGGAQTPDNSSENRTIKKGIETEVMYKMSNLENVSPQVHKTET